MSLNLYTLCVIYLIYSFLGWVGETVVATAKGRRFTNRGVASGPFCFVYGTAGVLITIRLHDQRPSLAAFWACCNEFWWLSPYVLKGICRGEILYAAEHLHALHGELVRMLGWQVGCQTGFYFLVRDMKPSDAIALVQESMAFIAAYAGEIPGASRIECGNYLLHDLAGAKQLAASMIPVLEGWKEENLIYEK